MKICLFDFEDSFTYNIAHLIALENIPIEVKKWQELTHPGVIDNYEFFILGPGPGHVDDYLLIEKGLQKLISNHEKRILGICLGHQLVLHGFGANLVRWEEPLHGRSLEIITPEWLGGEKHRVQFYNSWGVDPRYQHPDISLYVFDNKVMAARGSNFLSFQFHPESVGTTCPKTFFNPFLDFYYNRLDGSSNQTRRNI